MFQNSNSAARLCGLLSFSVLLAVAGHLVGEHDGTRGTLEGQPQLAVVVAPQATDHVKGSARILADYFGKISGGEFEIKEGDGSEGISVGLSTDFPAANVSKLFDLRDARRLDEYLLRSHRTGLLIIGATETAVRHGVWDLLHRLGHRQFFPGKTWEIVPRLPTIAIDVDELVCPAYAWCSMFHGFGCFLPEGGLELGQWLERNRMTNSRDWSFGHVYQHLFEEYPELFQQHPEYRSLIDGKRQDGNFCISNPGIRKFFLDYSLRWIKEHPDAVVVSAEPSDGAPWCECEPCKKLGTPSDRALVMANEIAEAVEMKYPKEAKYVGLLSYAFHSPPPTRVRAHPRVLIGFAQGFVQGKLGGIDLIKAWVDMGVRQYGIYQYFSIYQWDFAMPARPIVADLHETARRIRAFQELGAVQFMGESTDSFGAGGLGMYLATRVLWDVNQADHVDEISEDFLTKCFGSAYEPMKAFYEMLDSSAKPLFGEDMIGRMYRHLDAARRATKDPQSIARINHLILYTRFVDLYRKFADLRKGPQKDEAFEKMLRFAYRINNTHMVPTRAMYYLYNMPDTGMTQNMPPEAEFSIPEDKNPWKDSTPFSQENIDRILREGVATHRIHDIEPVVYSENLVPARPLGLKGRRSVLPCTMAAGTRVYYTWVDPGGPGIRLKVKGGLMPRLRDRNPERVTMYFPADSDKMVSEGFAPPTNETTSFVLRTPHSGLHRIEVVSESYNQTDGEPGTPFVENWTPQRHPSDSTGAFTAYFFVPTGTQYVGGYAQDGGSGCMRDGNGKSVLTFAEGPFPGYFKVKVPQGQDGKVWKFDVCGGTPFLMTVPPFLARSPEELLIPEEVLKKELGFRGR